MKKKNKDEYALFLKFSRIKDERFAYRKHALASSIQPYVAAMMMEISAPYIAGRGQVLDPFCGTGTLLMERNYQEHAHSLYGVDIYGKAIEWANEHARTARMDIHYVNKDMVDFSHKYRFDLLVSNPPCPSPNMPEDKVRRLYFDLFEKCHEWLQENAVLVLYSQAPELLMDVVKQQKEITVLKETNMYKQGMSKLFIMQYCPNSATK